VRTCRADHDEWKRLVDGLRASDRDLAGVDLVEELRGRLGL
jgi:hypothetical protein